MKKRFLIFGIVLLTLLSFTGCNNNSSNEEKEPSMNLSELEDTEVTNKDVLYYYEAYDYIQDFYKGFYFVSDAIEDIDRELFDSYLIIMKDAQTNINKMNVPSKYNGCHEYLTDAIEEYLDGIEKLYNSYENCNLESYLEASDILANAESTLDAYVTLVYNDFEDVSSLFSALLQNEYYMDLIDLYTYKEDFTEEENNDLFTLERLIKKFANLKNDLLFAVCKNDSISSYEKALSENLNNIKNLKIENNDIKSYRDSIVKEIEVYVSIIFELSELMDSNFDNNKIKDLVVKSDALNYNIYKSLSHISDFYDSYGIDIGYSSASEDIENMLDKVGSETNK